MLQVALLWCLLVGVAVGDPEPSPSRPMWPELNQPSQFESRRGCQPHDDVGSYIGNDEGWGSSSGSGSWGGYEGGRNWGDATTTRCGPLFSRRGCAPSVFDIESQLLRTAQKMSGFCNAYSNRPLREVYGVEHFKLLVHLPEFYEDNIQVRVQQRLVTILASTCSAEYAAVRVLPDVVNAHRALWRMEGTTLTVLFPYNITPDTQIQSRCGREFHGDPIIVPKSAAGTQFVQDYDVDFTDEKLKTVIRRALQEMNEGDDTHYIDK